MMTWKEIDTFLRSEQFHSFWMQINIALFWISLPVMAFFIWLIIKLDVRRRKALKQIKKDIHAPGMEDVRKLMKPFLKDHGIEPDDKQHERN